MNMQHLGIISFETTQNSTDVLAFPVSNSVCLKGIGYYSSWKFHFYKSDYFSVSYVIKLINILTSIQVSFIND